MEVSGYFQEIAKGMELNLKWGAGGLEREIEEGGWDGGGLVEE